MKNKKHVALAKKTIEYWQDTHSFKIPADIKHDMLLDFSEALYQVESEALAASANAKVVFTEDDFFDFKIHKEIKERTKGDDWYKHVAALDHNPLAKWQRAYAAQRANEKLRSITLAPKEPVISADINKKEISNDMSKKCEKCDQSKTLNEKSDISRCEREVKVQGFSNIDLLRDTLVTVIDSVRSCDAGDGDNRTWEECARDCEAICRDALQQEPHAIIALREALKPWQAALSATNAACGEFDEWWVDYTNNWDEDLKLTEINTAKAAFLAGHANALAQSKAATMKLPERKFTGEIYEDAEGVPHDVKEGLLYRNGFNACLDAVKSMNEGSGE